MLPFTLCKCHCLYHTVFTALSGSTESKDGTMELSNEFVIYIVIHMVLYIPGSFCYVHVFLWLLEH